MPTRDNIVWLCEEHHNEIEGIRPYNWRMFWTAVEEMRGEYKESIVVMAPKKSIPDELMELRQKRITQGYLDAQDAKRYQSYWMDPVAWEKLWHEKWKNPNHQERR